ncbi:MAG: hypothetical protein RLZ98_1817 [Pseudomonadota bacterium]|jgi:aminoglycoside 6'-N-acetyltransferase
MTGASLEVCFVPLSMQHLALLSRWMAEPHWRQWWGEPEEELEYIIDMIEGRDTTRPYIFTIGDRPLGYIQVWFIADQLDDEHTLAEHAWVTLLPNDAVGIDLSIGEPDALGKGYGSRVLRAFSEQLWREGHRSIVIDPDPRNTRAIRAYEKAGFRPAPDLLERTGDALIMQFEPVRNR